MEIAVFYVGHLCCGLDILEVQEITRIHNYTPVHGGPPYVTGLVNMRGQIITLVDVRLRFGLPAEPLSMPCWSIIVPVAGQMVGLLVDSVGDVIHAEPEAVRPPPSNQKGVEGYYFCAVTNVGGQGALSVTSFQISVNTTPTPPGFTTKPATLVNGAVGASLTLNAAAFGSGPLSYQWAFNGNPLTDGNPVTGNPAG